MCDILVAFLKYTIVVVRQGTVLM